MSRTTRINILEVGDTPDCLDSADPGAKKSELQIESVEALSDGITRLNVTNVDCIVSAYNLPDGDGIEFLQVVRKECGDLPFVLYADEGDQTVAAEAVSSGVTEYVPSELHNGRPEVLSERVRRAIEEAGNPSCQYSQGDSQHKTATEESPRFVFVLSPKGTVRSANLSTMCSLDTTNERLIDSLFWETPLWTEEVRSDVRRWVNQAASGECVEWTSSAMEVGNSDTNLSGEIRPTTDEDGEISTLIVIGREIDRRDRSERPLSTTKRQLALALDAADAAVWEMDLETEELHWDERAQELWGYEPGEFTGTFEEFKNPIHSDDWKRMETAYRNAIENRSGYEITIRVTPDGNSMSWIRAAGQVVTDDAGEPTQLIGLSIDVTESKEQERMLRRKTERLDEFASVVSHDLRNPLNIAHGRATMLQQHADNAKTQEQITPLVEALERMESIIDDTLTLAREGKIVDEMDDIRITDLVGSCWASVKTGGATIEIEDKFTVHGDRDRLKHVFENLFRNAVEHGGDELTVRVGRTGEGLIYVEDDGPGIAPGKRNEVFEPGHSSTSDGTGFGLTIVKRIVEAHSWTISLTDGTDNGARFEFGRV